MLGPTGPELEGSPSTQRHWAVPYVLGPWRAVASRGSGVVPTPARFVPSLGARAGRGGGVLSSAPAKP